MVDVCRRVSSSCDVVAAILLLLYRRHLPFVHILPLYLLFSLLPSIHELLVFCLFYSDNICFSDISAIFYTSVLQCNLLYVSTGRHSEVIRVYKCIDQGTL